MEITLMRRALAVLENPSEVSEKALDVLKGEMRQRIALEEAEGPRALVPELGQGGIEYVLQEGHRSCWITVRNVSVHVYIQPDDVAVVVGLLPLNLEHLDPGPGEWCSMQFVDASDALRKEAKLTPLMVAKSGALPVPATMGLALMNLGQQMGLDIQEYSSIGIDFSVPEGMKDIAKHAGQMMEILLPPAKVAGDGQHLLRVRFTDALGARSLDPSRYPAVAPERIRYVAYWGEGYDKKMVQTLSMSFFIEERGYDEEDVKALSQLAVGQIWRDDSSGVHLVVRTE